MKNLKSLIRKKLTEEISIGPTGEIIGDMDSGFSKYEVISYDVWGNDEDGYEVNQSFHTGSFIDIPDYDLNAADLIMMLRNEGVLLSVIKDDDLTIDLSHENAIYFSRSHDNKPLFELRKSEQ